MKPIARLYRSISIRNKIFIFNIMIIVISISVQAFYSNEISTKAIIEKAIKNSDRELVLIDTSLQTLANNIEDYSRILSSDFRLQEELTKKDITSSDPMLVLDTNSRLSAITSNIIKPNTSVIASTIISSENVFYDVGGADKMNLYEIFDRDFISHVIDVRVPVWTGLFRLRLSNGKYDDVLAVAKAIIHKDLGKTIGVSVLYINEKLISSIYTYNTVNANDRFYILDGNGYILSTQDKADLYQKFDEKKYGIEKLAKDGYVTVKDGNRTILLTSRYFGKLNWRIISMVSMDDITTERTEINKMILVIGILCLVFSLAVSLILSTAVTKPVRKLVKTMNSIEQGMLDKRANISTSDEFGVLSAGFNRLMDRIKLLLSEVYTEQKKRQEYEFKLLQAQVNPHFLYNTIETIISLVTLEQKDSAITAAKSLASFYRISLSKGKDMIPIKEELQLINSYLVIQGQRYSEYMDFSVDFDDDILNYKIPKLTVQPIAENSIYHGLKPKGKKGKLEIKGYRQGGNIIIEMFDDGVGISPERLSKIFDLNESSKDSFGLVSVDARIKLLFGNGYGVSVESKHGEYTRVKVCLPVVE